MRSLDGSLPTSSNHPGDWTHSLGRCVNDHASPRGFVSIIEISPNSPLRNPRAKRVQSEASPGGHSSLEVVPLWRITGSRAALFFNISPAQPMNALRSLERPAIPPKLDMSIRQRSRSHGKKKNGNVLSCSTFNSAAVGRVKSAPSVVTLRTNAAISRFSFFSS